jgi:hypothetical protein
MRDRSLACNATSGGIDLASAKRLIFVAPVSERAIRRGFATSVEIWIWIWDRDLGCWRPEAGPLDDLDCFGSAGDAELPVDRRDVRLDRRACEVKPTGDLLQREVCRQEAEEPELAWCEPVVLSSPYPPFEALQPGWKRSPVGISL